MFKKSVDIVGRGRESDKRAEEDERKMRAPSKSCTQFQSHRYSSVKNLLGLAWNSQW